MPPLPPPPARAPNPALTVCILCRVQQFPLGCIAPVTVLWSPPDPGINNSCREEDEGEGDATAGEEGEIRRVWLWVHPAAAEEASKELRKASVLGGATWVGNIEVLQRVSWGVLAKGGI